MLGEDAPVTACLLSQILAGRGRTGLAALSPGFDGGVEALLEELIRSGCRFAVAALPERQGALGRGVDTAVILTRGTGEAAEELLGLCRDAVINLDDEVDELFVRVKTELTERIAGRMEGSDNAVDLIIIAKYLERVADHAVNIANWAIFCVTGELQ